MSSQALWYLTRGTGAVTLILLTTTVALGVANVRRTRTANVPRFVFEAVHRNAALLAMAFLFVHVGTAVLDKYAPIRLLDVVIPFRSSYRPVWLGLGSVAFDLLVAVALTSMLRRRFGYRAWRATHWAAYASWPIALVHGLGTGSDTKTTWMLGLSAACVIVVIVAVTARVTAGWPAHSGARISALAASALVPLGLLVWLPSGPLAAGWAKRAGTPPALLRASASGSGGSGGSSASSGGGASATNRSLSGTINQHQLANGLAQIDISLHVGGGHLSALHIQIEGQPIEGGGVAMTGSTVTLGPAGDPGRYRGSVVALDGSNVHARVRDSSGAGLGLIAELQLSPNSNTVSGSLIQRTLP